MLRWIIPLSLIALPVAATGAGLPSDAWWEKITVRMTGNGQAQGCRYETSRHSAGETDCKVVGSGGATVQPASSPDGYSTITFERRFSPGSELPGDAVMEPGDKLLGRDVMALAIDHAGKVSQCKVVASSGETGLSYGCDEIASERFEAAAAATTATHRQGYMIVLVYGHSEHVV